MAAQRKKGPVTQKRFVVLLDGEGLFDRELTDTLKRRAPELIFETLATLEVKNISTLSAALGISRDRMTGIMDDLDIRHIYQAIRKQSRKRTPSDS